MAVETMVWSSADRNRVIITAVRVTRFSCAVGTRGAVYTGSVMTVPYAATAPSGKHVQPLDKGGERHGGVDVSLRHMEPRPFGDQGHADHQQESERQHDDGRVA